MVPSVAERWEAAWQVLERNYALTSTACNKFVKMRM
jgi:hypothetical protein